MQGVYSCTKTNTSYKVNGLSHSAVRESSYVTPSVTSSGSSVSSGRGSFILYI